MYHSTKDHIDNHNILSVFQHGFRADHSCDSQLLSTVYDLIVHIWFEMSSRRSSAWFFQGLWCRPTSEAPWENQALRHQRYDPSLDQWLSEWKHTVSCCRWVLFELVYCSIRSATGHRTRSPPLLLYIYIYINDLPDCINSRVWFFADDCLVYRKISSFEDQLALQRNLDALEVWASACGMKFNPSKCNILSIARFSAMHTFYTLCDTVLQHVSEAKYLGVTVSNDLQWSKHISNLSVKASSTLGLPRRNFSQCPQALREQA